MAGLKSSVLTLLIFDIYPYMITIDTHSSIINQCNIAIHKAIKKIKRFYTSCKVNDILNTLNCFFINLIYDLPCNSLVFIFCEKNINQLES